MSADTLILNRNLYAIHVTSWQRALGLVFAGHASVVDEDYAFHEFESWVELSQSMEEHPAGFVHTPTVKLAIPEVIVLKVFGGVPKRGIPFTRRNIYHHYGNSCCYCGRQFPSSELNLDHVIPRSRGGTTGWSNVVTACLPCNLRKGSRLPKEAGMRLLRTPAQPKWRYGMSLSLRSPVPIRRSWQKFIDRAYWDSRLEP